MYCQPLFQFLIKTMCTCIIQIDVSSNMLMLISSTVVCLRCYDAMNYVLPVNVIYSPSFLFAFFSQSVAIPESVLHVHVPLSARYSFQLAVC